jgi:hypothetical protein
MARTYRRDSNGRFSGGGGGSAKKGVRTATRGTNRLTRDNAGRITSVGGQGATARGGRLRTAAGNKRGAVVARIGGKQSGVVGKAKGARSAAPKKTSAKYKLTPSRLNEKLAEYDHSRAMRAISSNTSPFPEGGKRRKQTIKTARSAERFRQSLQAEATRLYREVGKDWAKARVAAFSMRPRYSTKQGVRRVWGPRTNPSMTKIKGW